MENERETLDLMNVESFSQLPFIRPATVAPPPSFANDNEKGVAGTTAIRLFGKDFKSNNATTIDDDTRSDDETTKNKGEESEEANIASSGRRKFECHYCCRNFPTSQALGGHQNAHKRERQHAKRAHFQSAMGLINYGRYPMSYNNSWNINNSPRFYEPHPPPLNGSPLALWRVQERSSVLTHQKPLILPSINSSSSISPSSRSRLKHGMQNHVSLDLHL